MLGGKRSSSAGGGTSSQTKGWKGLFGWDDNKGGKSKKAKRFTRNRSTSSDKDRLPPTPMFVDNSDSPRGEQSTQRKEKQVPESRRQRGASTGGKTMGHVSDSAETVVTAIARADISSARKLDAVFDDLAGFEAKVAAAKRQLASRIAEEFPADPSISEHVNQNASLQGRLGEARERGKPWEASYERGWSVNPVPVSCSLSTRMRISIAALDLGHRH